MQKQDDWANSIRHPEITYTKELDGVAVHAGFPNAGNDASNLALNLQQMLVKRPVSTFLFRVAGDDWQELGIFAGDIAVIDRSLDARPQDLVCWWHYSSTDFGISYKRRLPQNGQVWGTVTSIIHNFAT